MNAIKAVQGGNLRRPFFFFSTTGKKAMTRGSFARCFSDILFQKCYVVLLLTLCSTASAVDFATLCADHAAIERVYYNHRTGTKASFEETLPRATLENLVQQDLKKESVLRKNYGITITPALLDAEVNRINTTTRAPEMLAEIKAALGNDPTRFAEAFARPILVERLLHDKFENDDALHAAKRHESEQIRNSLLAARTNGATAPQLLAQLKKANTNAVTETTWQLTPRPAETNAPAADELDIKKRFGPDAQIISGPHGPAKEQKFYFEELPPALQNVLRVQLRHPGDVSAVIETPGGFLLYVVSEKSQTTLSAACLSLPKRSYEEWLTEQKP
ncbi:hypothetical protein [Pedosphaera parvula]|nr:hypothetical protein [Pedosphaera parvula]